MVLDKATAKCGFIITGRNVIHLFSQNDHNYTKYFHQSTQKQDQNPISVLLKQWYV